MKESNVTPQEKAIELFNVMCNSVDELIPLDVKQCALISATVTKLAFVRIANYEEAAYWRAVERELEKL
jgi:hypothetical protein